MFNLSMISAGRYLLSGVLLLGSFSVMADIAVPGKFMAGDFDPTPDTYYNKQFVAEGATLKNDYPANPDVLARITKEGQVGNTSTDDFFTYKLEVAETGDYKLLANVSTYSGGTGAYTLTFTKEGEPTQTFSESFDGQDWSNYISIKTEGIHLTEGSYTMVFTVDKGLNFRDFTFILPMTVDPELCTLLVPGKILGGDLNDKNSYHKQFLEQKDPLKNDYKANPDAQAKINSKGVLGNTSTGDRYGYYFMAETDGIYDIVANVEGPNVCKFQMTFDGEYVMAGEVQGTGWNNGVSCYVGQQEFKAGPHYMLVEPLSGINFASYEFTRVKLESEAKHAIPEDVVLAGNLDEGRSSYWHQKYAEGDNKFELNSGVAVRIDDQGHILDASKEDFFSYTLNCIEAADYYIYATLNASPSEKEKQLTFTFDDTTKADTGLFSGEGWDKVMNVCTLEPVHLEEGIYTMKVDLPYNGGMHLHSFEFSTEPLPYVGVNGVEADTDAAVNVYSIDGTLLKKGVTRAEALEGLTKGLYIVGGKKVVK